MKTDAFTVTLGVLLLLLGGAVLYCNGTVSGLFGVLGFPAKFPPVASAAGLFPLLLAPVVGWFAFGMGAVLTGLTLHAKKLI